METPKLVLERNGETWYLHDVKYRSVDNLLVPVCTWTRDGNNTYVDRRNGDEGWAWILKDIMHALVHQQRFEGDWLYVFEKY